MDLSYVEENNGIEAKTVGWFKAVEAKAEGGEISEKRKMFSHRELPFPTTRIALGVKTAEEGGQELTIEREAQGRPKPPPFVIFLTLPRIGR
ncbi:MAG TPA: hypothetical protein VGP65_16540 [Candidatus Angelobacter sp.]|jgi:hypothetical protein|nr:hypothetical protein [Candidatus Angelobacter sp.]